MSELKWSASASSASLDVASATRVRARARKKSTTIEMTITPKAMSEACTAWLWPPERRCPASQNTAIDSTNSRAVSPSAATLSILP